MIANTTVNKKVSQSQREKLFRSLQVRFENNMDRHQGQTWGVVQAKLEGRPDKIWSLSEMEETGGEPDLVGVDTTSGEYLFYDCSFESPIGRRSPCYDQAALVARKENKPTSSAMEMATDMGIELLTEQQYRLLQQFGPFDCKTSSWIQTPMTIRRLGGALFADRRYDTVFVYHNGVESYYAARGFRGVLRV